MTPNRSGGQPLTLPKQNWCLFLPSPYPNVASPTRSLVHSPPALRSRPVPPLPRKPLAVSEPCGAIQLHDTALHPAVVTQQEQLSTDRIRSLCLGPFICTLPTEGSSETYLRSRHSDKGPCPPSPAQARADTRSTLHPPGTRVDTAPSSTPQGLPTF